MKRFLFWLITIGIVVGACAVGYGRYSASKQSAANGHYRTAAVKRTDVTRVVNSTGTVKPIRSVEIGSFVSGPILEVLVDFNSKVTKGQLLAKIDARLYTAALARENATLAHSKADMARVQALLEQAIRLEKRGLKLKPQNAISETDMEQYTTERKSLEAQVGLAQAMIDQSKANLSTATANMKFTEIESPVDGIVTDRKVDPGQTVAASFQTPTMFVIAPDLDKSVYVYASVDEADIGMIRQAQTLEQPVTFTVDAYPSDSFQGRIAQVRLNPTTVQNVVTYTVIVQSPNPETKLLPGMTANLTFQIEKHDQVLAVPNAALRFHPKVDQVRNADRAILEGEVDAAAPKPGDNAPNSAATEEKPVTDKKQNRKYVWVIEEDLLAAVEVVVGLSDKGSTEILSGNLTDGQELVTGVKTTSK